MTRKTRPPGGNSRGSQDTRPAGRRSVAMVTDGGDGVLTEEWLRRNGHPLAAGERARQREIARIKVDRLLGLTGGEWEPPRQRWECPGQFGGNGQWVPCCRGDAA
jgi:hypothetical protein